MQKHVMGALALGLVSAVAQAQSSVTVYGIADAGLVLERGGPAGNTQNVSSGVGSGSRLGFKGKEDLGGGLVAGFQLENGYNIDTGTAGQGGLLFGRQAYVSLSGSAGSISAGRQYMPYFKALRDVIDPFGTGFAGNVQNIFFPSTRVDNSVEYMTKKYNGFSADLLYGFGETAGDASKNRTISGAASYDNGPLSVVLTHHQRENALGTAHTRYTMLGGRYRYGDVTGHAAYSRNKDLLGIGSRDALLGVTVSVGADKLLASYIDHRDDSSPRQRARQAAIGYLHPLSVRTDLYAAYGHIINRNGANFHVGTATDSGTGTTGFNLGVRHVF
ncbi:porin [Duganella sp. BJB1802]|uniref:porin n=1 Tax=Duganella sp. BJB1802 TaxID=2744575 RepID=UPI0015947868|nr:porin [Duganella sp. BJB1802]NVD74292.1 porin [Duganella sp. BJB1802]